MIRKVLFLIFSLSFVLSLAAESFYEDTIKIIKGRIKEIEVYSPTKVMITNPSVADVTAVDNRKIEITAKEKGLTELSYQDKTGKHSFLIKVIPEDISYYNKQIKKILHLLGLRKIRTHPVEDDGKIFLLGSVRTPEEKDKLKNALGDLAKKIVDLTTIEEDSLVEIAVEVLELDKDATRTLGFNYGGGIFVGDDGSSTAGGSGFVTGLKQGDLFRILNFTRSAFEMRLDLLIQEGKARVLSRPRLVCQSGKEAELMVGGEVPILNTQIASTTGVQGTQIEYKDFGIKLKINPAVSEDDKIQLALNVEVSEVGDAETIGSASAPTAKAFPLTKRTVSTQLYLRDGETLAIGGLIKQKSEEDLKRYPWLSDVPILGAFFRHREIKTGDGAGKRGNRELFITLYPKIVKKTGPLTTGEKIRYQEDRFLEKYKDIRIPSELEDYVLEVQRRIITAVKYPPILQGTGWKGEVLLRLKIDAQGNLKEADVLKSSGYKIFDDDALNLVKNLTYPPFPEDARIDEIKIKIPIIYKGKK